MQTEHAASRLKCMETTDMKRSDYRVRFRSMTPCMKHSLSLMVGNALEGYLNSLTYVKCVCGVCHNTAMMC